MANKFVRASKYRHVGGDPAKPDKSYSGLRNVIAPNQDTDCIAGNSKFFAVAYSGGGGPLVVWNTQKNDYKLPAAPKTINVHQQKLMDWKFNPFLDNCIATGGEDSRICVTVFPEDGLADNINEPTASLFGGQHGHQKKIVSLEWHPVADNVLASIGYDHAVKVWDVSTQQSLLNIPTDDIPTCLNWSSNGSRIGVTTKDKKASIFDPRIASPALTFSPHTGSKSVRILFADNHNQILTAGFSNSNTRELKVFDPRGDMSTPLGKFDIDQSAGQMVTYYDPDTSVLFFSGKGDASIKYFELTGTDEQIYSLSEYRNTESHKGLAFLPKRACDSSKCEIAVSLRLMKETVIPVSFQVPRKSDLFQEDIFPDTFAGVAAMESKQYFDGENKEPVKMSMRPGAVVAKAAPKAPVVDIRAELAAAQARIKELEAKLQAAGIQF